jgi:hypothetical protein
MLPFRSQARIQVWDPPTAGEQVLLISPSGQLGPGIVLTDLFSDHRPANGDLFTDEGLALLIDLQPFAPDADLGRVSDAAVRAFSYSNSSHSGGGKSRKRSGQIYHLCLKNVVLPP